MDYTLEQSVGFMLGFTHRKAVALLATRFKPYDITTEQFSVLFNVDRGEGVNQKEARCTCLQRPTHHCADY